jgi:hypothetical protein
MPSSGLNTGQTARFRDILMKKTGARIRLDSISLMKNVSAL